MIPAVTLLTSVLQLAPALRKLFEGGAKFETVAGVAAEVAKQITGQDTNDSALEVLRSNPDLLQQYQEKLLDHEIAMEQIYAQDKQNARLRDEKFLESGTRNYRGDFLVGISVVVVFSILGIVVLVPTLSEYAKGVLTAILGLFSGQLANVFNFEFGTTRKEGDRQSQITSAYIKGD